MESVLPIDTTTVERACLGKAAIEGPGDLLRDGGLGAATFDSNSPGRWLEVSLRKYGNERNKCVRYLYGRPGIAYVSVSSRADAPGRLCCAAR